MLRKGALPTWIISFMFSMQLSWCVCGEGGGRSGKKKSVEPGVVIYTHNSNIYKKPGPRIGFVSAYMCVCT